MVDNVADSEDLYMVLGPDQGYPGGKEVEVAHAPTWDSWRGRHEDALHALRLTTQFSRLSRSTRRV